MGGDDGGAEFVAYFAAASDKGFFLGDALPLAGEQVEPEIMGVPVEGGSGRYEVAEYSPVASTSKPYGPCWTRPSPGCRTPPPVSAAARKSSAVEPGAHPTRQRGRWPAHHQLRKAKGSTDSVGGPSRKIEVRAWVIYSTVSRPSTATLKRYSSSACGDPRNPASNPTAKETRSVTRVGSAMSDGDTLMPSVFSNS